MVKEDGLISGFLKKTKQRKSQLISMDFVIAFVVFIFALSFFFFIMADTVSYDNYHMNAPAELIFSRMDQVYPDIYDYLDSSKVDIEKLHSFILDKEPNELYDFIFEDFRDPGFFKKIDYCVFIENRSNGKKEILVNFAAHSGINSSIHIGLDECGRDLAINFRRYTDTIPKCIAGEESLILSKPVLYNQDIMDIKILMCGQRR